jgi:hypothetical protein
MPNEVGDFERLQEWFGGLVPEGFTGIDVSQEYDPEISLSKNKDKLMHKIKQVLRLKKNKRSITDLDKFYEPIYTAINKVCQGYSNLCFIKGRGGIGKSYTIKKAFEKNGVKPVEVTGEVTEAYLYRLIYENNGKPIWLRDVVTIMSGLKSLNLLKSATETDSDRRLTKSNYSRVQNDMDDEFNCESQFIFDYNNLDCLSKKLREDFEAFLTRGDYIEMMVSDTEVKQLMRLIAKTPEQKEVTEFIISNFESGGLFRLNLRNQYKAFQTYGYAKQNSLDWKKLLKEELTYNSQIRSMLYSLMGRDKIKTADLKRLLMQHNIVATERTADRRIKDWLFMGEITRCSEDKNNFYVTLF